MILRAQAEILCDADGCPESLFVVLLPAGDRTYSADDDHIERELLEEDWICTGHKHFCSMECAETSTEEN